MSAIRLVDLAGADRVETTVRDQPECLAMKRPGKPDTGNPFVRFDEERSGSAKLTTTVGSIRLLPFRLLYQKRADSEHQRAKSLLLAFDRDIFPGKSLQEPGRFCSFGK